MDEARQVSYYSLPLKYVVLEAAGQAQPPLDYLIGAALDRLGVAGSDAWVRLPAALFGAGGVLLLGLLVRRVGGDMAGVVAAALLAVCPLHVAMSQEARPYTIFFFFAMAATLTYLRAREGATLRRWAVFAAMLLCMLMTRWVGPHVVALCLVAHAVGVRLAIQRSADEDARRAESARFVATAISCLAAYVVYNPIFGLIYALDKGFAVGPAGQAWGVRVGWMLREAFDSILGAALMAQLAGGGLARLHVWIACIGGLVGAGLLVRACVRRGGERSTAFAVVALAFPLAYAAIYARFTWFPAKPQYLLLGAATFCTVAALCVRYVSTLLPRRRILAIAAASSLFCVFAGPMTAASLRDIRSIDKPDWRGALGYLREHADSEDAFASLRPGGVRKGAGSDIIGVDRYLRRDFTWLHVGADTNVEALDTPLWTRRDNTLWILCNAAPSGAVLMSPPMQTPDGFRVHAFCRLFLLEIRPGSRAEERLIEAVAVIDKQTPDGSGLVGPNLLRAKFLASRGDVAGAEIAIAAARRQCRTDDDIAAVAGFSVPTGRIATLDEPQD